MKYLILGAGPAGLTFANQLLLRGETSFLVLEKEKEAGGLCRSQIIDGYPLDIGGGHFLDVTRPKVNSFLFSFMPESEWNLFNRDSRINIEGDEINHPIEANIWQFSKGKQVEYLKSIAIAGCNLNIPLPDKFVDWIYWKFGTRIAEDYMIPYNQKIFSQELNELGTYWLEKLPNVSFEETLLSCLDKRAYGTQPGHKKFYYPKKYGYGALWARMAEAIKEHIIYDIKVKKLDFLTLSVNDVYHADYIITTIPWTCYEELKGMPGELCRNIKKLKFSSVDIEYVNENINSKAQWIYYPDLNLPYHRILLRHNFCPDSRGYWTETNSLRVREEQDNKTNRFMNKYAYPLNTIEKPQIMKSLLAWAESNNVYGLGRWGEWEHYNSDVTVEKAMELSERMCRRQTGNERKNLPDNYF